VLPIAAVPGYQHLLAPSDLGETSAIGLTASALIAQRFGAQLTALHVRKWPDGADEDAPKVDDAVYGAALGELQAQLAGIDPAPTPAIAFGDRPADRIVSTAGEIGCDLITMPSTGKGTLERIFLGSCAERVCKLSSLPVLVTPVDALARWA
jgi:nucleotide-binding universal stress UspA family protein